MFSDGVCYFDCLSPLKLIQLPVLASLKLVTCAVVTNASWLLVFYCKINYPGKVRRPAHCLLTSPIKRGHPNGFFKLVDEMF